MKKNMSSTDRIVRIIIALVLGGLFFANIITGTLGYIALAIAIVFLGTSLMGWCGLYAIFGISTCKTK